MAEVKKVTSKGSKKLSAVSRQSSDKQTTDKPKTVNIKKTGSALSVPVYSLLGKEAGSLDLPKEIFGVEVNEKLLAQAVRVYASNKKGHFSNTKTRGEVEGSTRKIYQQKGTGRARHGGIRAPIFVGGGIALGPKFRKITLELPQKMKRASLLSALSQKAGQGKVLGLDGVDKASGKTKEMAKLVSSIMNQVSGEKTNKKNKFSVLMVGDKNSDSLLRAVRNIQGVHFLSAEQINVYEVIAHKSLILTKQAVEKLQERLFKKP